MNQKQKMVRVATASLMTGAVLYGVAAPALAEGYFQSALLGWDSGRESRQWIDRDIDATDTHATFYNCNKNNFTVGIYKEDAGPDTRVGYESLQCTSSADAVRAGRVGPDEYHFTLKSGSSIRSDVKVYW